MCKHCMIFAPSERKGKFVSSPATHWTKALTEIKEHAMCRYHQDALLKSEEFVHHMANAESAIYAKMDKDILQRIEDNRQVLSSIIKTVLLCGRQGLTLRGHRGDGVLQPENTSNFNALLLQFRIDSEDEVLKKHLQSCDPNASYISKTTQNNMIDISGDQIRDRITSDVKSAKHIPVLADEAADSANWEQLVIVLRYVDGEDNINEDFLGFVQCEDTTEQSIADKIIQKLQDMDLEIDNIRGQGYDGASNMAAKYKGEQARILERNPKALYFHCAAHCLNLAIVKSCEVPAVKNMFEILKTLSLFFSNSPKRQRKLEAVIDQAFPYSKCKKLVDLCRTRWVERHSAFETFEELFKPVADCLGQISEDSENFNAETVTKAAGFLQALQSGPFLVAFVVMRKCLQYVEAITIKLQTEKDIVEAYREIGAVTDDLQGIRDTMDRAFVAWFAEANTMRHYLLDNDIERPRTAGRQTLRDNQPADNPETYFRRAVAIPAVDHLLNQLRDRLKNAELAAGGLCLVPENVIQMPRGFNTVPHGLVGLTLLWDTDLPNAADIEAEFNRWVAKWHSEEQKGNPIPTTATAALKHCNRDFFPNLHKMLSLICTLPITTAHCERNISRLRTLKTHLRSTMGETQLDGLTLMFIHRNIAVDVDKAVDAFASKYRTQMKLLPRNMLKQC